MASPDTRPCDGRPSTGRPHRWSTKGECRADPGGRNHHLRCRDDRIVHHRIGEMRCHVRSSRTITDPGVASTNASPDATKVREQASFTITTIAHRSTRMTLTGSALTATDVQARNSNSFKHGSPPLTFEAVDFSAFGGHTQGRCGADRPPAGSAGTPIRSSPDDTARRTVTSIASRADDGRVTRIAATMADGREIIYFDETPDAVRVLTDPRDIPSVIPGSHVRYDVLLGEWVGIAGHRQTRTYHPPADACPLCPSTARNQSEIPSPDYDVVVFENRFPSFAGAGEIASDGTLFETRPGNGRCEVVCFTSNHHATLSSLPPSRMRTVIDAWADRTAAMSASPGVEQVFCFENRGVEIGVTLAHPHGQIYGYPFVTPKTAAAIRSAQAHRAATGYNLFAAVLAGELAA